MERNIGVASLHHLQHGLQSILPLQAAAADIQSHPACILLLPFWRHDGLHSPSHETPRQPDFRFSSVPNIRTFPYGWYWSDFKPLFCTVNNATRSSYVDTRDCFWRKCSLVTSEWMCMKIKIVFPATLGIHMEHASLLKTPMLSSVWRNFDENVNMRTSNWNYT